MRTLCRFVALLPLLNDQNSLASCWDKLKALVYVTSIGSVEDFITRNLAGTNKINTIKNLSVWTIWQYDLCNNTLSPFEVFSFSLICIRFCNLWFHYVFLLHSFFNNDNLCFLDATIVFIYSSSRVLSHLQIFFNNFEVPCIKFKY